MPCTSATSPAARVLVELGVLGSEVEGPFRDGLSTRLTSVYRGGYEVSTLCLTAECTQAMGWKLFNVVRLGGQ